MTATSPLISATELYQQLEKGQVAVVDCRFSLNDTSLGEKKYREAHIPGAHYGHLDHDWSSPIREGESGRHPLPDQARLLHTFKRFGLNDTSAVVFYDDMGGAIAARAWWLCRWLGHAQCQVLDGGFKAWTEQNYPLSGEVPPPGSGTFSQRTPLVSVIEADEVMETDRLLIDARDPDRYSGKHEPLDPVAGHIAGACNQPFPTNLDANGKFLPPEVLRENFAALVTQANGKTLTHYCGSGVTAAHNILAMTAAGMDPGVLYAGSWSEWIQDPDRPTATLD